MRFKIENKFSVLAKIFRHKVNDKIMSRFEYDFMFVNYLFFYVGTCINMSVLS